MGLVECAKLLKTPKVYNAIITTDENLTPSQAYPLIQPVIQPTIPVLSPFHQTTYFDPYSRTDVNHDRKTEQTAQRKSDDEEAIVEASNTAKPTIEQPQTPKKSSNGPENQPKDENSPIPLNEFGFPPSLIPLQKFPNYPYNYPFIYDSYGNFQTVQQYPVLPPSFYPQQEHQLPPIDQPMFQVGARKVDEEPQRDEKALPVAENSLLSISNDAIKNNGNRNKEIPDVEIPPIPFTFKKN